ncbi:hypothetical protein [Fusobacterium perfoetens]|uniref:hypothetical protein n=1 Tax=Fusobacterium perfoetens TaxID=852 RepID=UPI0004815289|nr:hypothetical protein [Fusobacterium perfoetens]
MRKKILNIFFIFGIIFILNGCTILDNYLGKKNIKSATDIYNEEGVTLKGVEKLVDGLENVPHSLEGTTLFNVQYYKILEDKNLVMKKSNLSIEDIEKLKLYVFSNEEAKKLSLKNKNIIYNSKDYDKDKNLVIKKIENFILAEKTDFYSRDMKIQKIEEYQKFLEYVPSPKIFEKKVMLEKEVTIEIGLLVDNLGFDTISNIVRDEINKISNRNYNLLLDKYIYFKGANRFYNSLHTDYIIEMVITRTNITPFSITTEEKDGKTMIIKENRISIDGYFNLFKVSDRKLLNRKHFSFETNYTIHTIKENKDLIFENERHIIEDEIRNKFDMFFLDDIKTLVRTTKF